MTTLRIPGPLDPHVHLRGMAWDHKGNLVSETSAALAGGYTAVLDMPNTPPTTTTPVNLATKIDQMRWHAVCDWGLYYGAHPDGNADTFTEVMADTVGLKIYGNPTTGDLYIDGPDRDAHFVAWNRNGLIAVHAEGEVVGEILDLVALHGTPVHFCHISTRYELSLLRQGKDMDLPISVGVCPHHLFLTHQDEVRLGPKALMKPPLKSQRDQDALWSAVQDGLVDIIESDHAPHSWAEKEGYPPAFGVPGLETTLPLMGTAVVEGRLDTDRLIELVSTAPRRIFGLPCPSETWTELDMDWSGPIHSQAMQALCRWTPFEGWTTRCRVVRTQVRGVEAYDGERIKVAPGFGEQVLPQRVVA